MRVARWLWLVVVVCLAPAVLLGGASSRAHAGSAGYALAPQDRVTLRIVSWNEESGRHETLDALGGTFAVGPEGALSLPVVGVLEVAGLSLEAVSERVSAALHAALRLGEAPSVSAEIAGYRPVFVIGDVAQPGVVAFSPGMTVLHALALAGGTRSALSADVVSSGQALRAASALREARVEIAALRVREARLRAERDGAEAIGFPPVLEHPDGPAAIERLEVEEATIFQAQREALERELAAIADLEALLREEIAALENKSTGIAEQLGRMSKAVGDLQGLVDRGLARAPALLNQQRSLLELEGRELDIQTALSRSRQALSEAERDAIDLRARRVVQAATSLQETRARIARQEERARLAAQLVIEAGASLASAGDFEEVYHFQIHRDGESAFAAPRGTTLQGGDVVEVTGTIETRELMQ